MNQNDWHRRIRFLPFQDQDRLGSPLSQKVFLPNNERESSILCRMEMNRYGCIFMRDVSMRQRTVTVEARTLKNEAIKNTLKATKRNTPWCGLLSLSSSSIWNALIKEKDMLSRCISSRWKWLKNYLLAQLADKVGWCTSIETTMDSKLTWSWRKAIRNLNYSKLNRRIQYQRTSKETWKDLKVFIQDTTYFWNYRVIYEHWRGQGNSISKIVSRISGIPKGKIPSDMKRLSLK